MNICINRLGRGGDLRGDNVHKIKSCSTFRSNLNEKIARLLTR